MSRPLEILVACVALVVLAPVILVALVFSAIALRVNPVFGQVRVGRDDAPFTIYKVRTLPSAVSTTLDKYHLRNIEIPTACRLMRRFHVDELLQLVNVVKGSMSIVGPRPEMPHLVERMSFEQRHARRPLRPGMTGLWQVSVDAKGLMYEHPEYDIAYSTQRSFWLDLRVALNTLLVVTRARAPLSRGECGALVGSRASDGALATTGETERAGA